MIVRDASADDHRAVRELLTLVFGGTRAEADLLQALRHDGDAAAELVAEADGAVVGHVMLSRMSAAFPALGLGPLVVAETRQREGIGTQLVQAAVERAKVLGALAVFVLGDPAFYRRFGFSVRAAAGFTSPYAGPYLMALPLNGGPPVREGQVDYARAFADLPDIV